MRPTEIALARTAVCLVLALWVAAPATAEALPPPNDGASSRIVAVGDIHGELAGFRRILQVAGLIDETGRWTGGSATLVQLGDYLDRGPGVRGVMDLLMRLEAEAREDGGEVVALLGNHEQMNLLTLYDDVTPEIVKAFAGEGSEARSRRAYEEWVRWERSLADGESDGPEEEAPPPGSDEHRAEWMEEHPPGWLEYHAALGPEGRYGRWIRDRPVAAIRGGALFMHAGLSPDHADRSVEEMNRLHAEAFQGFDRVRRHLVREELAPSAAAHPELRRTLVKLGEAQEADPAVSAALLASLARDFDAFRWTLQGDSPLWFRGYARWPEEQLRPLIDRILATHGVSRVVVGHSPLKSASVHGRLEDRVLLIDTGMLDEVYGGRASALELEGGRITAIYPDEHEVLVEAREEPAGEAYAPPPRRLRDPEGNPAPLERAEELMAFLRQAEVVDSVPLDVGVTGARRLVLDSSGERWRAVFHDIDEQRTRPTRMADGTVTMYFRDSYRSQVAAYELSRLMGLPQVPPTVQRTVAGERGSVQLWIEDAIMWKTIQEEETEVPDPTHLRRQIDDLRVWDNLIHNTDRNQGNILFDPDWNLWWIDNTRSFSPHKELVAPELVKRCSRDLWQSLRGLDEEAVRERLRPYLSKSDVRALLVRRDLLVDLVEEEIAELGEDKVLFDYDDPPEAAVRVTYEDATEER